MPGKHLQIFFTWREKRYYSQFLGYWEIFLTKAGKKDITKRKEIKRWGKNMRPKKKMSEDKKKCPEGPRKFRWCGDR